VTRPRQLLLALLVGGATLRLAWVDRPLDHRMRAPWRQADYTQIARNFWREDARLCHPRIDWRRDTPGFVEMELPLLPWLAGMIDRVAGYHEAILRGLSALLEIGSLLLFAGLARRLLPPEGALFAIAAFAINPLLIYLSTAMQPEPLMLFLSLVAIVLVERFDRSGSAAALLGAGAALGGAILAKAPAACLGFVFAWIVLRRIGWGALRRPAVYVAAVLALVPPAAWYAWAKHFWTDYGNSLGLSNEDPFLGLDMLWPPRFLFGILKWETLGVITPAGWLLLVAAARAGRREIGIAWAWLLAVVVLFVVTARTTADDWAFYYHAAAVAPVCLLMGSGFAALRGTAFPGLRRLPVSLATALGALTLAGLLVSAGLLLSARDHRPDLLAMRNCGLRFLPHIPEGAMIVAQGGALRDDQGHPVAHNQSMLFAWLDRKGFTYGNEELSVPTLLGIAGRGGRFWIADRTEVKGALGDEIGRRFPLVDRCASGYYLYDLGTSADAARTPEK
jgi:hypothetical protein